MCICSIRQNLKDIKGDYKDTDIYPSSIKLKNNKMFINKVKGFNNKFDIIVGNPPYQEDKASGDNKLYLDFTKNSLDILQDRGLLLFITPRNILDYLLLVDKNRNIINDFYQIKYIAIETSKHYFPKVGSTFVYFLIEKKLYYEKTIIEYMYRNKIEKDTVGRPVFTIGLLKNADGEEGLFYKLVYKKYEIIRKKKRFEQEYNKSIEYLKGGGDILEYAVTKDEWGHEKGMFVLPPNKKNKVIDE